MRNTLAFSLALGVVASSLPAAGGADARHSKAGALASAEAVVQTYLDGDPERFRSHLAEALCTLEGEGPFEAESLDLGDPSPFGRAGRPSARPASPPAGSPRSDRRR